MTDARQPPDWERVAVLIDADFEAGLRKLKRGTSDWAAYLVRALDAARPQTDAQQPVAWSKIAELEAQIARLQQYTWHDDWCDSLSDGAACTCGLDDIPGCWCDWCDITQHVVRTRMSLCPVCGDKRCPRAQHHGSECTNPDSTAEGRQRNADNERAAIEAKAAPQMTDYEIKQIQLSICDYDTARPWSYTLAFARAIEAKVRGTK